MMRLLTAVLVVTASIGTGAEDLTQSSALARELVMHLETRHLEAFATQDPRAPDRFIAVLYIADSQLLVVGARHPAAQTLAYEIQHQDFRDVYLDLQGSPDVSGKVFVHDIGADGLKRNGQTIPDNVYEDGKQTLLVKKGTVDNDRLARSEEEYGRMLNALLAALASLPPSASGAQGTTK